jgi:transposase InsO family protein
MDLGRFVLDKHLRTGRPIKELARAHDVSPGWVFKLKRRYLLEGEAGLEPRSRRPRSSPTRIADLWEDEIVRLRKQLVDDGFDAGAETIGYHLAQRHGTVPSSSTIWRVLKARGFVASQPHKRPKSSYVRFAADLPNECWQSDVTHVELPNGLVFEVLNVIDDHSRLCLASRAMVRVKAVDVIRVLHLTAEKYGYPASFLTDNGLIFTAQQRYGLAGAFEHELFALGILAKHSRAYHPQTCGKVERFHQTEKKFLGAQRGLATKKQLQRAIDRFVGYSTRCGPIGASAAGPLPRSMPLGRRPGRPARS